MMKIAILLMITAVISLFAACNLTDTDAEHSSLTIEQDALFSKDKGPHNPGQGEFYPLAIGNTWTYSGSFSMGIEGTDITEYAVEETRSITGMEELFGREYFIEELVRTVPDMVGGENVNWYRYRQDRAGLYEADVSIQDPPGGDLVPTGSSQWDELWQISITGLESIDSDAAARLKITHFRKIEAIDRLLGRRIGNTLLTGPPGGILPDEIQRLKYPLHVRQEWIIRETPLFSSTVERMEVLDLPAGRMNGWRISIYNEFLEDNDNIYLWYSRSGFLAMEMHVETETTLFDGTVVTMISSETLYLESYDLEKNGKKDDRENTEQKIKTDEKDLTVR